MWLPEICSGELIPPMGFPESLAVSQHSVRRHDLGTNKDYRKDRQREYRKLLRENSLSNYWKDW